MRKIRNATICVLAFCMLFGTAGTEAGVFGGMNAGVSASLADAISTNKAAIIETENITVQEAEEDSTYYGYTNLGIVCMDGGHLNVREEASTDSSQVGKMKDGNAMEVLDYVTDDEGNGWYYMTSGGVTGYVSAEYILTGDEAIAYANTFIAKMATVTESGLRVREAPSTDAKIWYVIGEGEKFNVVEETDGWVAIAVDDEVAYVASEYVSVAEELSTAMTISEYRYGTGVSQSRMDLCDYALQFVGNPYVWGGTSLEYGCDCSGFVLSVYEDMEGISLPHYSGAQANCGTEISASEAQPGDLFFYGSGSINHVAIYIGDGQIVHAASENVGIIVSSAYYRSPICVVRILE